MLYNNKEVYTPETFDYSTTQIGDYVSQAVVDGAMYCLPTAYATSECAQVGEPCSPRSDPDTGRWRATYATFRRVTDGRDGIWEYRGFCFRSETTERGEDVRI